MPEVTITTEQAQALCRGESITLVPEPPKPAPVTVIAVKVRDVLGRSSGNGYGIGRTYLVKAAQRNADGGYTGTWTMLHDPTNAERTPHRGSILFTFRPTAYDFIEVPA